MSYPNGVDVSRWQTGDVPGADFYVVRLGSAGTVDPLAAQHVGFARDRGIPVGGYWALYQTITGYAQADLCFGVMARLGIVSKPIFADAEQFPNAATLTLQTIRDFVARMLVNNGHCGIYSGGWIKDRGGVTAGASYGWLADWRTDWTYPADWTVGFTKLHQYGEYEGTGVDGNHFLGTLAEMYGFFGMEDSVALAEYIQGKDDFIAAYKSLGTDPGPPPATATTDYRAGWRHGRFAGNNPTPIKGDPGEPGPPGAQGETGPSPTGSYPVTGTVTI